VSFATRLLSANPGAQVSSALSGSLTTPGAKGAFVPDPASSFDALSTVIVPSGGLSTITFAGIPQTGYSNLQIRYFSRSSVNNGNLAIRVGNGSLDSSSNYAYHRFYGEGSGTGGADASSSITKGLIGTTAFSTSPANVFAGGIIDILDYASSTKTKTIRWVMGRDENGSGGIQYGSVLWNNTNPINTIGFLEWNGSYTFDENTEFALYGVR
jgi:hypothetical protein